MKRALLLSLAAAVLVACQDDQISAPTARDGPRFDIKDGAHGGNPDVFFLPPLVPNPRTDPEFGNRPSLLGIEPFAVVWHLTGGPVPECVNGTPTARLPMEFGGDAYSVNWHTGSSGLTDQENYRIQICLGALLLAHRDVTPVTKPQGSCKSNEFCQFKNGSTLPIKVRIETAAACLALDPNFDADNESCATASLEANESLALQQDDQNVAFATVDKAATINMRPCVPFRDRATKDEGRIDLPTFGPCVEIDNLDAVSVTGVATLCEGYDAAIAAGLSAEQARRMTVHRFSAGVGETSPSTVALPHADEIVDCNALLAPIGLLPDFTRLERLARATRRAWRGVGEQVRSWMQPAPLWASAATATVCDLGGCGGFGDFESDYQVALPAWMDFHPDNPDGDLGSHDVGTVVTAKVRVRDSGELDGGPTPVPEPVKDVRLNVMVTSPSGSVSATEILTDADGIATFELTVGLGENTVEVTGIGVGTEGLAGTVLNVFAPSFNGGETAPEVELEVGTLTFTATGIYSFESVTPPVLPSGWTLAGTGGSSGGAPNLNATDGDQFAFLLTPGVTNLPYGGTGGSTLESPTFTAQAGDILRLDFNFLTNDGTVNFRDFMFVQLRDASSDAVIATIGNANTTGAFDQAIPAFGPPPPPALSAVVALSPATAVFDGILTGPIGTCSGTVGCGGGGQTFGPFKFNVYGIGPNKGGSTGYVRSTFPIPTTGTYKLFFVVQDFGNRSYPSGVAIDNVTLTPPLVP